MQNSLSPTGPGSGSHASTRMKFGLLFLMIFASALSLGMVSLRAEGLQAASTHALTFASSTQAPVSVYAACSPTTVSAGGVTTCIATVSSTQPAGPAPTGKVSWSLSPQNGQLSSTYCTLTQSSVQASTCSITFTAGSSAETQTITAQYSGDAAYAPDLASAQIVTQLPVLSAPTSACSPSSLFATNSGWLGINMLVILLSLTLGAAIYSLSNLMPGERGERLKGITRYEMFEALMGIVIVLAIFAFASFACGFSSQLTGQQAQDPFVISDAYLGTLLLTNGVSLISNIYQASVNYVVASNLILFLEQIGETALTSVFSQLQFGNVVSVGPGVSIEFVMMSYSSMVTTVYGGLLMVAFAPLYLLFLVLPIIKGGALTVVVPIALILRSLSFAGPKLREASNLFLALAIGFYFVLPLAIAFNVYVASCMNIGLVSSLNVACSPAYPFAQYVGKGFTLPSSVAYLFTQQSAQGLGSQLNIPGSDIPFSGGTNIPLVQAYGINSAGALGSGAYTVLNYLWNAPNIGAAFGQQIADYLFLSLFMVGIDIAITAGFINGLGKGLNAISRVFGVSPFWGE